MLSAEERQRALMGLPLGRDPRPDDMLEIKAEVPDRSKCVILVPTTATAAARIRTSSGGSGSERPEGKVWSTAGSSVAGAAIGVLAACG